MNVSVLRCGRFVPPLWEQTARIEALCCLLSHCALPSYMTSLNLCGVLGAGTPVFLGHLPVSCLSLRPPGFSMANIHLLSVVGAFGSVLPGVARAFPLTCCAGNSISHCLLPSQCLFFSPAVRVSVTWDSLPLSALGRFRPGEHPDSRQVTLKSWVVFSCGSSAPHQRYHA